MWRIWTREKLSCYEMRMWIKEVKALLMLWNGKIEWEICEWKHIMMCEWEYDIKVKALFICEWEIWMWIWEMRKWEIWIWKWRNENCMNVKRSESTSENIDANEKMVMEMRNMQIRKKWKHFLFCKSEVLMQMRNMKMKWGIHEWEYDITLKELSKYEMSHMH